MRESHLWCVLNFDPMKSKLGDHVEKISCIAVTGVLALMIASSPAFGQVAKGPVSMEQAATGLGPEEEPVNPQASFTRDAFAGNTLACTQAQKLQIPRTVAKRARLKAELMNVLRQSIFDDAKGIVNLARERQIKELVNKLTKENQE